MQGISWFVPGDSLEPGFPRAAIVFQLEAGAASFKMAGEWRQISGSQFCDICRQENRKHTGSVALLGKDVAGPGFILN